MNSQSFITLADDLLLSQCDVHCYRSSGPGGQKKNKTSSAVRLQHRPTGLVTQAEEDRSQHINKARALKRLRMLLATDLLAELDVRSYRPGEHVSACLAGGRLEVRLKDERALPVINEVLSVLDGCGGRVSDAARAIGITTANLVKFLRIDPHVWRRANHIRQSHGLEALTNP